MRKWTGKRPQNLNPTQNTGKEFGISISKACLSQYREKKQTDIILCHFPTGNKGVGQSFEQSDFSGDCLTLKIQWYSNAEGT